MGLTGVVALSRGCALVSGPHGRAGCALVSGPHGRGRYALALVSGPHGRGGYALALSRGCALVSGPHGCGGYALALRVSHVVRSHLILEVFLLQILHVGDHLVNDRVQHGLMGTGRDQVRVN